MKSGRSSEKRLTLPELLIVVGIMAVLGAVGVLALTGLIEIGTPEARASELSSVQIALDAHYSNAATVGAMTARTVAAKITSTDTDAPVGTYIRRLPTKYSSRWTLRGW